MKGGSRNVLFTLLLVIISCISFSTSQVSVFLEAFPNANATEINNFPIELLIDKTNYVEPKYNLKDCPSIGLPQDADNVTSLRPGNIKVVMAMGDSITAAMSAKDTSILSMKEYRGLSYAIGGDSGVVTMPNLLKPYLQSGYPIGASTGVGKRTMSTNGLNAAVSGAINVDLLSQAQWLVQQLQANSAINYAKDWKLLTLWIGSNNLCDVCDNAGDNDAANYEKYVTEALEYIRVNVPRVFVNLVVNLDITQLDDIDSGACNLLHTFACNCVTSSSKRKLVLDANLEYQLKAYSIAANFAAKNDPEFAVVVQPFLEETLINERSELSAADCFHPSAVSHSVAAIALWNNMITPAAQKKLAWNLNDSPLCATADTLLYTN